MDLTKHINPKTGLVAVEMKISEAGLGLRAGEIRGVSPEIAEIMITRKHATLVDVSKAKTKSAGETI